MPVREVSRLPELNEILEKSDSNRLIIVDFFANWCGPCRMISPAFERLSMEFGNATFLKVNTDLARDIVMRYSISAMPTFLFFKNKQQVDSVRGANESAIISTIRKHYSSTPANPNAASDEEKKFLERFVGYTELRKMHTDEVFKALARSVMPDGISDRLENGEDEKKVLQELLDWFKNDFFTWFDRPTCLKCTLNCTTEGLNGTPTKEEKEGGAGRVEVFICNGCNSEMRFPRYNDPSKLLQTRTGRCGEWANCFGLILSAAGLENRFVLDTTDHVWNEVYLKKEQRWIHVDPCENTMDRPLLYTRGWKKQLKYCIAYGHDHVSDVTWRYVFDSKKLVTQERNEVRQGVLENFLGKLNARQMAGATEERKRELAVRRVCELMGMMVQEAKNQRIGWEKLGEDMGGRTTGSKEWRRARGELGDNPEAQVLGKPIEFRIQNDANHVEFSYDVNRDSYSQTPEKGFVAQTFEYNNIQRKVENDWKMVYLCREDGKKEGNISWHFNLAPLVATDSKKTIEKVEIRMAGIRKFENGNILIIACLGDTCMRIPASGNLTIEDPKPEVLKITVTLSGGERNQAFQHAQLFRTENDDVEEATEKSEKRLNKIDDLIRVNLNVLPRRKSNLSAVELCTQNPSPCLPGLKDFEGEIRTAPRYQLSTCVVQKSMSTVMTSMFCYLRDEKKFIGNHRELLKDWKIIRFCMFKNEFRNLGGIQKKFKLPTPNNWTHIMMVRHPFERFVSGFVDKCYRKPVIQKYCNGCSRNLTCFMETELARMWGQIERGSFQKTYEDRHFFPQSWRCNLHQYFQNFTFIPYSSSHNFSITSKLFPIFREHSVPESSLTYIQTALSSGRTAHSTVDSKATSFIEKRLRSSPYLMELLVKMFYHDFVLFNFTLPAI
ncbi:hypothetical protein L3Y34_016630 [Caenorhabditis briggsae]|uniref:Peptide-N(4)-(N-acetyl-beta-glucosaminyl)asparagine amidase n=1 Tax=Caenorhabditis briggsae TaxID=6238 RepID=A0AAE9J0T8_CAEBR|nr:hypothetical protein L3Y34_016630 [Caenorhabditis briggsae]